MENICDFFIGIKLVMESAFVEGPQSIPEGQIETPSQIFDGDSKFWKEYFKGLSPSTTPLLKEEVLRGLLCLEYANYIFCQDKNQIVKRFF